MEQPTIITVDSHQRNGLILSQDESYFEKRYETRLKGCGFLHANHLNCEYSEHCCIHHTVVVYLQAENSVRQIGDTLQSETINSGDVAIVPAHVNHWKKAESKISEAIIITIAPDILSRLAREKTDARSIEILPAFAQPNFLVQSIALNLKAEFDSGDGAATVGGNGELVRSSSCFMSTKRHRSYIESLYNALMMHLLNNHTQTEYNSPQINRGLAPYQLKQALNYINQNIDKSIKIQDIAKLLGISQYYFCRLFRESTGIAPYRYVIQQRISKAKTLMEEDKMSLLDIAFECGFSSQSQMTYHFHKLVGTTPKVYCNHLKQSV